MMTSQMTTCSDERLRARLDRRSCSAASPHVNRKREAKRGGGKGGRGAAKRAAIAW